MKTKAVPLHLTPPDDILLYDLHCCTKCVLIKRRTLPIRLSSVWLFGDINKERRAVSPSGSPLIDSDSRDLSPGLMLEPNKDVLL